MTKNEAAIISLFTGILIGDFSEMHKYAEKLVKQGKNYLKKLTTAKKMQKDLLKSLANYIIKREY